VLQIGGYAHVYLTHSDTPLGPNKLTTHCLKRLAFREEQAPDMMKDVEKEIEVMKALRGNPWIVEYLGSEVRRTGGSGGHGAGWEVFILMEFCAGE
jgi:serine/threonine protein kinase